jgi:hypothetical protein
MVTGGPRAVLLAALAHSQSLPTAGSCESLASLALGAAEITRAQVVPAGQFAATPAGVLAPGARAFLPYSALPAFCRIAATLRPSSDSDIKIEVWMPASGWNGKFVGLGNGGWAGAISVRRGLLRLGQHERRGELRVSSALTEAVRSIIECLAPGSEGGLPGRL